VTPYDSLQETRGAASSPIFDPLAADRQVRVLAVRAANFAFPPFCLPQRTTKSFPRSSTEKLYGAFSPGVASLRFIPEAGSQRHLESRTVFERDQCRLAAR